MVDKITWSYEFIPLHLMIRSPQKTELATGAFATIFSVLGVEISTLLGDFNLVTWPGTFAEPFISLGFFTVKLPGTVSLALGSDFEIDASPNSEVLFLVHGHASSPVFSFSVAWFISWSSPPDCCSLVAFAWRYIRWSWISCSRFLFNQFIL